MPKPTNPGVPFPVYVCKADAAFTYTSRSTASSRGSDNEIELRTETALAVRAPDGRVFMLGPEVHLDGTMTSGNEAIANRALDRMTPEERAALDAVRPTPAKKQHRIERDDDWSWPHDWPPK